MHAELPRLNGHVSLCPYFPRRLAWASTVLGPLTNRERQIGFEPLSCTRIELGNVCNLPIDRRNGTVEVLLGRSAQRPYGRTNLVPPRLVNTKPQGRVHNESGNYLRSATRGNSELGLAVGLAAVNR